MKMRHHTLRRQLGMTLIEVIVTIGILSIFFVGTLGMYSKTYSQFRYRDALMTLVDESDRIMTYIGDDIRNSYEFIADYKDANESHQVVAAMKRKVGGTLASAEHTIIYFLDTDAPGRLVRTVITPERLINMELSTNIDTMTVTPHAEKLFEVQLSLQKYVAGKASRSHIISKFAMRY